MSLADYTRANDFDRIVGKLQTDFSIENGVGNSILDIGCGIGEYTTMFHTRFREVYGLDPDKQCLEEARKRDDKTMYVQGYGEDFTIDKRFDTISMNNILEHVDEPVALLENCFDHLNYGGRIIVQVPNSQSITRRLGMLMGIIPSTQHISKKEAEFWGHKRTYDIDTLARDCENAGLNVVRIEGVLYKPFPNETLWEIYQKYNDKDKELFLQALVRFGKPRPDECACLAVICE